LIRLTIEGMSLSAAALQIIAPCQCRVVRVRYSISSNNHIFDMAFGHVKTQEPFPCCRMQPSSEPRALPEQPIRHFWQPRGTLGLSPVPRAGNLAKNQKQCLGAAPGAHDKRNSHLQNGAFVCPYASYIISISVAGI
jgi:hypothetical protein